MKSCLALVSLLILVSCSSVDVKEDYDTNFNYSNLKQYSWLTGDGQSPVAINSLIEDRVHKSVEARLEEKGFHKVENDKADFLVNYHYVDREVLEKDRFRAGFGIGSTMGFEHGFGRLGLGVHHGGRRIGEIETLAIDVIDASSRKLIWRGLAQERLMDSTPQETNANFVKVVNAILEKFPPSKKK